MPTKTEIKFSVKFVKDVIHLFDNTGKYHITKNKTGWGVPNVKLSDARAEVHIYEPGESEEPLIFIPPVDSIPSDEGLGVEIAPEDFGKMHFSSGVYKIDYLVYHGDKEELIYSTCNFLYTERIKCCIDKKKLEIDLSDVQSETAKKIIESEALLSNSKLAFELGRYKDANKILNYLDHKCGSCH